MSTLCTKTTETKSFFRRWLLNLSTFFQIHSRKRLAECWVHSHVKFSNYSSTVGTERHRLKLKVTCACESNIERLLVTHDWSALTHKLRDRLLGMISRSLSSDGRYRKDSRRCGNAGRISPLPPSPAVSTPASTPSAAELRDTPLRPSKLQTATTTTSYNKNTTRWEDFAALLTSLSLPRPPKKQKINKQKSWKESCRSTSTNVILWTVRAQLMLFCISTYARLKDVNSHPHIRPICNFWLSHRSIRQSVIFKCDGDSCLIQQDTRSSATAEKCACAADALFLCGSCIGIGTCRSWNAQNTAESPRLYYFWHSNALIQEVLAENAFCHEIALKVIHFAIICRSTRGSISSYNIAWRISEVFEDVAT